MKTKYFLAALIIIFCSSNVFSYLSTFTIVRKNINVDIKQSENLIQINLDKSIEPYTDLAYKSKNNKYEIRYIYFGYNKNDSNDKEIMLAFPNFVYQGIQMLVLDEKNVISVNKYNDSNFKKDFNCEFGESILLKGNITAFSKGYNYILMNLYLKYKIGIICQMVLYNDEEILLSEQYIKDLKMLRFKN